MLVVVPVRCRLLTAESGRQTADRQPTTGLREPRVFVLAVAAGVPLSTFLIEPLRAMPNAVVRSELHKPRRERSE
jgi:hypothetical protein